MIKTDIFLQPLTSQLCSVFKRNCGKKFTSVNHSQQFILCLTLLAITIGISFFILYLLKTVDKHYQAMIDYWTTFPTLSIILLLKQ